MIKAKSETSLILGITDANLERLRKGQPILVRGSEWGEEKDIVIFHGTNERAVLDQLQLNVVDPAVKAAMERAGKRLN